MNNQLAILRPSRPLAMASHQPYSQPRGGGSSSSQRVSSGDNPWGAVVDGLKNGIASGLATACSKLLLQPFDTLKTVQQVKQVSMKGSHAFHPE